MSYITNQEIQEFINMYRKEYYMSMFCEIGYHAVRNGGYTIVIHGMIGNAYINNKYLNFYPMFKDDVQASKFCSMFCTINNQFKNKGHMEIYDFLPLEA